MPTYGYRCKKCLFEFEVFHSITSDEPRFCPECKEEASKLMSSAAIVYKGTGFYTTDYCFSNMNGKEHTSNKEKKDEKNNKTPEQE